MAALKFQGGLCAYCETPITYEGDDPRYLCTWDHIVPRSKGGGNDRQNRVLACFTCNMRKANRPVLDVFPNFDPTRWVPPAKEWDPPEWYLLLEDE